MTDVEVGKNNNLRVKEVKIVANFVQKPEFVDSGQLTELGYMLLLGHVFFLPCLFSTCFFRLPKITMCFCRSERLDAAMIWRLASDAACVSGRLVAGSFLSSGVPPRIFIGGGGAIGTQTHLPPNSVSPRISVTLF